MDQVMIAQLEEEIRSMFAEPPATD